MKKHILSFLICMIVYANGISQNEENTALDPAQNMYFMKSADGYYYINDQDFYTMKFQGADLEYMDNGGIKIQDNIVTIIEENYDTSVYNNSKGVEELKQVLEAYKDTQVAYFESVSEKKMSVKESYFRNTDGKLFYQFSIDIPIDKVDTESDYLQRINFLCFIVNDRMSTIGFPLFKSEDETEKQNYIKAVAESVAIFPSHIDVEFLRRRVLNTTNEKLVVDYEEANFSFVVPEYLNVVHSDNPTIWSAGFPDVNGVKNAVVMRMVAKENYKSFEEFNQEVIPQGKLGESDGRITLLLKEELDNIGAFNGKSIKYQFKPNGTPRMYHAKRVTFETKTHYGFVMFNATPDTYKGNIERFDAFLKTFIIKK